MGTPGLGADTAKSPPATGARSAPAATAASVAPVVGSPARVGAAVALPASSGVSAAGSGAAAGAVAGTPPPPSLPAGDAMVVDAHSPARGTTGGKDGRPLSGAVPATLSASEATGAVVSPPTPIPPAGPPLPPSRHRPPSAAATAAATAAAAAAAAAAAEARRRSTVSPSSMAVIAAAHYAGTGAVLSEEGAVALAADMEFVLRETVQEALKFMRHAKRSVLTGADIEDALRLRGMEPLYGAEPCGAEGGGGGALVPAGRGGGLVNGGPAGVGGAGGGGVAAGTDPVDTAGWPAGVPRPLFRRVDAHLFVVPDAMVDVREAIRAPLPRVPLAPSLTAHWLALDGVQPSVPENPPRGPPLAVVGVQAHNPLGGRGAIAAVGVGSGVPGGGVGVGPAMPGAVPSRTSKRRRGRSGAAEGAGRGGGGVVGLAPGGCSPAPAEVLPVLTHELSNELQLYYQHVISAVRGSDAARRDTALASVAVEPGLSPLLPYLTRWVHNEVDASLRSLPSLLGALRLVGAVLANGQLGVEAYLHQLLPPVLTCLVGRRLCGRSREDHWALRDYAAGVVGVVVSAYAGRYTSLQPRITKTLVNAVLDPSRPLTTHYGATVGLAALGGVVVERLLLPHVAAYAPLLEAELVAATADTPPPPPIGASGGGGGGGGKSGGGGAARRAEAVRVYGAILSAVGGHLRGGADGGPGRPRGPGRGSSGSGSGSGSSGSPGGMGGGGSGGFGYGGLPYGAAASLDGDDPGSAAAACWPALRRRAAGAADLRALGEAAVAAAVPGYTADRLERLLSRYGEDRLFPFRATDASALHGRLAADAAAGVGRSTKKTPVGGVGGGGRAGGRRGRGGYPASGAAGVQVAHVGRGWRVVRGRGGGGGGEASGGPMRGGASPHESGSATRGWGGDGKKREDTLWPD
ncbi:hypothetical protein MMPV_006663 [Pyropia vietnamensis]